MNRHIGMQHPGRPQAASTFIVSLLLLGLGSSWALGQDTASPGQSLQERLVEQLRRGNEEQRLDAAAQLGGLFDAAPNSATSGTLGTLTQILQQDSSPVLRAIVARAFETCCDARAVPVLLAGLTREREIAVRKAIIYALARHHSSDVVSALLPLLNDKSSEIRAAAAYALAEIGDGATLDPFVTILQKRQKAEDAFARSQAARGLGKIGNHAAIDILLKALGDDKSAEVRREAARSLGLIATKEDSRVIDTLRRLNSESDPYLTAIIVEALQKINSRDS